MCRRWLSNASFILQNMAGTEILRLVGKDAANSWWWKGGRRDYVIKYVRRIMSTPRRTYSMSMQVSVR